MKTGFTFKGVHTSTMGVTMRSKSRPILPEVRQSLLTLPSADGTLDYSAANEYGRSMSEDRMFTVLLYVSAADVFDLQCKASKLAVWLMGSGELIFDDMPEAVWEASVFDGIDFVPESQGRKALITVNFRVQPFSHAAFDVLDGITLDSDIHLSAMVPLNISSTMEYSFTGTSFTFDAFNYGSAPVRAKFIITPLTDAPGEISLLCGERGISVNCISFTGGSGIEINTEKCTVIQNKVNASGLVTGQFFELAPGSNSVTFTAETKQEYKINLSYTPRFIYNADWQSYE